MAAAQRRGYGLILGLSVLLFIAIVIIVVLVVIMKRPKVVVNIEAPPTQQRRDPPIFPEENPRYPLRGQGSEYQQIGALLGTPAEDGQDPTVLPLFGRPSPTRRDRWEYYSSSDKNHMWRVPVEYEGRNCQEDVACNEIQAGDKVRVPIYKNDLTAQIYKYDLSLNPGRGAQPAKDCVG
jgi:hypothetical protein